LPGKPLEYGRNDRGCDGLGRPDPRFSGGWVGEEIDVLHALPQFVEDRDAAFDEASAIGCRLHAVPRAVEQAHPERTFEIRDRFWKRRAVTSATRRQLSRIGYDSIRYSCYPIMIGSAMFV
jgi:hypothetical protein